MRRQGRKRRGRRNAWIFTVCTSRRTGVREAGPRCPTPVTVGRPGDASTRARVNGRERHPAIRRPGGQREVPRRAGRVRRRERRRSGQVALHARRRAGSPRADDVAHEGLALGELVVTRLGELLEDLDRAGCVEVEAPRQLVDDAAAPARACTAAPARRARAAARRCRRALPGSASKPSSDSPPGAQPRPGPRHTARWCRTHAREGELTTRVTPYAARTGASAAARARPARRGAARGSSALPAPRGTALGVPDERRAARCRAGPLLEPHEREELLAVAGVVEADVGAAGRRARRPRRSRARGGRSRRSPAPPSSARPCRGRAVAAEHGVAGLGQRRARAAPEPGLLVGLAHGGDAQASPGSSLPLAQDQSS